MDRCSQKDGKDRVELSITINRIYNGYLQITLWNSRIHILIKLHGTFTKTQHNLGYKSQFNKSLKIKVLHLLSDHNGNKPETDNKEIVEKS